VSLARDSQLFPDVQQEDDYDDDDDDGRTVTSQLHVYEHDNG